MDIIRVLKHLLGDSPVYTGNELKALGAGFSLSITELFTLLDKLIIGVNEVHDYLTNKGWELKELNSQVEASNKSVWRYKENNTKARALISVVHGHGIKPKLEYKVDELEVYNYIKKQIKHYKLILINNSSDYNKISNEYEGKNYSIITETIIEDGLTSYCFSIYQKN